MERIRFDDQPPSHPARHPELTDRDDHGWLGVQGTADDRLASRLGGRTGRQRTRGRAAGCCDPGVVRAGTRTPCESALRTTSLAVTHHR